MRYEHYPLDVLAVVGYGAAFDCQQFVNMVVVLDAGAMVGTFHASTLQLQASQDGTAWIDYGAAADDGVLPVQVVGAWHSLRVHTVARAFGTQTAHLSVHNSRTS